MGTVTETHMHIPPLEDFTTPGLISYHFNPSRHAIACLAQAQTSAVSLESRPQGEITAGCLVDHPCAWLSSQFKSEKEYLYTFTPEDIADLDAAIMSIEQRGITDLTHVMSVEDLPLPRLGPKLQAIGNEVVHGKGFQLLRGLPVERWGNFQSTVAFWAIGVWLGKIRPSSSDGAMICHMKNSLAPKGANCSPERTQFAQPFHVDGIRGIVGLMCVGQAAEGGGSRWVSSVAVHNELLKRGRKDLVDELMKKQWYLPEKGFFNLDDPWLDDHGKCNYEPKAILSCVEGWVQGHSTGPWYLGCQKDPRAPRYSAKQLEAITIMDALSFNPDVSMNFKLRPGDCQLLNNAFMLHNRDPFQDSVKGTRHLVRWWVLPYDMPQPLMHIERSMEGVDPIDGAYLLPEGCRLHAPTEPPFA